MAREARPPERLFFVVQLMEDHSTEIAAIIADLQNYLLRVDEYGKKPLAELDYFEIHTYNVSSEENARLSVLMQQLCPSDYEDIEMRFNCISRCSHPFSSLHVSAGNSDSFFPDELPQLMDHLRKEIHKTIQHLMGSRKPIKPKQPISLEVAVGQFSVSRATLKRMIAQGRLKSYRPENAPYNAPHIIDAVELAAQKKLKERSK